jgi:hypothetical protein
MSQVRQRTHQMLRALNAGVPIRHGEKQDVRPRGSGSAQTPCRDKFFKRVVPTGFKIARNTAWKQPEIDPPKVIGANTLFQISHHRRVALRSREAVQITTDKHTRGKRRGPMGGPGTCPAQACPVSLPR